MATILVIDDEQLILNNLIMLLEFEHFNVLTSLDGKGALNILQSEPVNLILCDMLMVPMDGLEILHAVRQNPNSVDIPFVFLTGMRWTAAEAKSMGISGYLVKPYTRIGLLDMVHQQLVGDPAAH
jgi:CheY-like chemotaxis protein